MVMKLASYNNLIQTISKTPLFSTIPKRYLEDIVDEPRQIYVPRGSLIFKEGDRANNLYLIEEGKVGLEMSGDVKHEIEGQGILTTFTKNEFLCFQALIGRYRHSYSARTLTNAVCIEIGAEDLRTSLERKPETAMAFYKKAFEILSVRFNLIAEILGYRLAC